MGGLELCPYRKLFIGLMGFEGNFTHRDLPIMLKILPIMHAALLKNFTHCTQYLFLNSHALLINLKLRHKSLLYLQEKIDLP